MILLDENIIESQRRLLRSWRIRAQQIGYDVGEKGILDDQIIPFLHQQRLPTFFTSDLGFYNRNLCHARYCLVIFAVGSHDVAVFVRRFLRDARFKTRAKRMGNVIRVSSAGLQVWRLHHHEEAFLSWDVR